MMHFSCIHILHLVALITIPLLTSMCSGPRAAAHETWTITQLLTQGERVESVTEVVEVRNCGVAERKPVDCSAGTSNNFSTSLGLDLGLEAGIDVQRQLLRQIRGHGDGFHLGLDPLLEVA